MEQPSTSTPVTEDKENNQAKSDSLFTPSQPSPESPPSSSLTPPSEVSDGDRSRLDAEGEEEEEKEFEHLCSDSVDSASPKPSKFSSFKPKNVKQRMSKPFSKASTPSKSDHSSHSHRDNKKSVSKEIQLRKKEENTETSKLKHSLNAKMPMVHKTRWVL